MKLLNLDISKDSLQKIIYSSQEKDTYLFDNNFYNHFKDLKQVFMYITDRCNIGCEQCIYKPSINHYIKEEIELSDATCIIKNI